MRAVKYILPYKPAKIYTGKIWYIGFYVKDPKTGRLSRQRIKLNFIANKTDRLKHGRQMVKELNQKLATGWNPLQEELAHRSQTLFITALEHFIQEKERAVQDKTVRPDSLRAYKSYQSMIQKHIPKIKQLPVTAFSKEMILSFLDFIYYDLQRSARTRNNYLSFFKNLGSWLQDNGYTYNNPTEKIRKLPEAAKKREVLPPSVRQKLFDYLKMHDFGFYVLCLVEYYLFIRRTEIAKLKALAFDLDQNLVTIPAEVSKNGKDDQVTIPAIMIPELQRYLAPLKNHPHPQNLYFTGPDFGPSTKALAPKKISDTWSKYRQKLGLKKTYQFYSLKDSGITDMLSSGVPSIIVRDQARHYDVAQTDTYAARSKTANPQILDYL